MVADAGPKRFRIEAADAPPAVVDSLRAILDADDSPDAPTVRLFRGPETPLGAFSPPVAGLIEWSDDEQIAAGARALGSVSEGGVAAALFTRTALHAPIAQEITKAVTVRAARQLDTDFTDRMETALHEALANACLHGNLGLSVQSEGEIDAFHRAIADRAESDEGLRTVTVVARLDKDEVIVTVRDEGGGFSPKQTSDPRQPYSGRGLQLIWAFADELTFADEGREITMRFRWRRS